MRRCAFCCRCAGRTGWLVVKITKERILEKYIVTMYERSQKEDYAVVGGITAKAVLCRFLRCIEIVDAFEGVNHTEIVKTLYLCKNNLFQCGLQSIANRLYMQTRTLYDYRKKYAAVIKKVLDSFGIDVYR